MSDDMKPVSKAALQSLAIIGGCALLGPISLVGAPIVAAAMFGLFAWGHTKDAKLAADRKKWEEANRPPSASSSTSPSRPGTP